MAYLRCREHRCRLDLAIFIELFASESYRADGDIPWSRSPSPQRRAPPKKDQKEIGHLNKKSKDDPIVLNPSLWVPELESMYQRLEEPQQYACSQRVVSSHSDVL